MTTLKYDQNYWSERYKTDNTPWDIGEASTPIVEYFKSIEDKSIKILIPGCGNAHEAMAIFEMGFKNIYIIDLATEPLENFKRKYPLFPKNQVIKGDFFDLDDFFDMIVEQTFFCALHPKERERYVRKMNELLTENGLLIGLLFDDRLNIDKPPYGGTENEYRLLFDKVMAVNKMEKCYNSIKPREGRELFIEIAKRA